MAQSLQGRECVELADARTRRQVQVAQRQNLRIARFLNRIVFCFLAEDTGLLPKGLFGEIVRSGIDDPAFFAERLETLFRAMATGGAFGTHKIRHFNGHLFEEATVFELLPAELRALTEAGEADWQGIEPAIMGTLFERALDEAQRSQLGAHYTAEEDIRTLVEPVLMAPLRREWAALRKQLLPAYARGQGAEKDRKALEALLRRVAATTVLDPACGSGNFLYVALQLLLGMEKEILAFATQLGFRLPHRVGVQQLKALEINPYAYELAQVSVQIGWLQWMRDNGFSLGRSPVLQELKGFENKDALLNETFRKRSKNLKEARREEHEGVQDDFFKTYTERAWPDCEVIVGNPPFLGDKLMRRELGDAYVEGLRGVFEGRIPGQSDLCCYWFEKARAQIEEGKCRRAGLLATQGIRGGANREVLRRIKQTGNIFFAESDRAWVLAGANVHVSMVGFDNGTETAIQLDGRSVEAIDAQLGSGADLTVVQALAGNRGVSFIGASMHGPFAIEPHQAAAMLASPCVHGRPSSDVIRPWSNGLTITQRASDLWIVDFDPGIAFEVCAQYDAPFRHVVEAVKPLREKNRRAMRAKNGWILGDPQKAMREAVSPLPRYIGTPRVAKHRLFVWFDAVVLPTDQVVTFARSDDYFFGVLHSRFHEIWALRQGTQLREKESGFRYTPTTCFETFPLLRPTPEQEAAIGQAARELNGLRERWLNPPEWTRTGILEFPGTVGGPWDRFIDPATAEDRGGFRVGTVRYPRLVPQDANAAASLKKRTLTALYNERPAWLVQAHATLDAAVAAAYGWEPEMDEASVLKSLLDLNHTRAAEAPTPVPRPPSRAKTEDEML